MSDTKTVQATGYGILPSLLTVLFVGLKLTGHIDWSWWWVLSPLWLPLVVVVVLVLLWVLAAGLAGGKK